jgi:hypothetical protein
LVKDGVIGPITREVERLYFEATRGHLRSYENWLEPVYRTRINDEQDALSLEEVNAS